MKPLGGDARGRESRAELCLGHDFFGYSLAFGSEACSSGVGVALRVEWIFTMSTAVLAIVLGKICSMPYYSHERRDITRMLELRESRHLGLLALYQYCVSSSSILP